MLPWLSDGSMTPNTPFNYNFHTTTTASAPSVIILHWNQWITDVLQKGIASTFLDWQIPIYIQQSHILYNFHYLTVDLKSHFKQWLSVHHNIKYNAYPNRY